jgi:hypothetical protein
MIIFQPAISGYASCWLLRLDKRNQLGSFNFCFDFEPYIKEFLSKLTFLKMGLENKFSLLIFWGQRRGTVNLCLELLPMSSSLTGTSSHISSGWRVRSWVQDPLGVCVNYQSQKKKNKKNKIKLFGIADIALLLCTTGPIGSTPWGIYGFSKGGRACSPTVEIFRLPEVGRALSF